MTLVFDWPSDREGLWTALWERRFVAHRINEAAAIEIEAPAHHTQTDRQTSERSGRVLKSKIRYDTGENPVFRTPVGLRDCRTVSQV